MTGTNIIAIITIVFASTGFWAFLQNRMQRRDQKNDNQDALSKKLDRLERDGLRTQLLLLILLKPGEQQEILTIAEHYFRKPPNGLGGDWYMTTLFNKWLIDTGVAAPDWFNKEE